ncbi:flagellar export protein FliJ [Paeniglutamicibacter antarcticus]|uniref:Flagellar export protein FliJ n=1 Tax=Arthrobacter terrae TaxID=2935737 RepID=A0A931G8K2_9MICC|nr:flagellar export protein FliJ [Arthrobacter terrae]MBG0740294.1 flagellar export protein FliJ [Arthrobacter terrae]
MSRIFPLAGLLRLQHLRQDAAAADLAGANARASANGARQSAARRDLQETSSEVATAAALSAVAAARSSSRSMLSELEAASLETQADQDQAQAVFNEARAASVRLEKLAAKHDERMAAELLHAEQTVLDEIAVTSWHRNRNQDTSEPVAAVKGASAHARPAPAGSVGTGSAENAGKR